MTEEQQLRVVNNYIKYNVNVIGTIPIIYYWLYDKMWNEINVRRLI